MYYLKTILACFTSELTFLQKKEIELGLKNGLEKKQVRIYASSEYNFLQMREMRMALENGIDYRVVSRLMHADVSSEKMEVIRKRLEAGEKITKDYVHALLPFVSISLFVCLFLTLYQDEKPYLTLKEDTVTLECGSVFDPMAYIDSFSSYHGQLILPTVFDTEKPGKHVAVYKLETKRETVEKLLYVIVE